MARKDTAEPRSVVLQQQLALVLRNIEAGARKIAEQREIIVQLAQAGHDTSEDFNKLANLEREHAANVAIHRRLMRELTTWASRCRRHLPTGGTSAARTRW
jgi:hypothetical protein